MAEFIVKAMIGGVFIGFFALIKALIRKVSKPAYISENSGTIKFSLLTMGIPAFLGFAGLCGLLFFLAVRMDDLRAEDIKAIWGICAFLAVFTYVFGAALMSDSAIHWSEDGVSGPSTYGLWPFGPKRATIGWQDITEVGPGPYDSTAISNKVGTKIRFSQQYAGHDALFAAIKKARPDLFAQ